VNRLVACAVLFCLLPAGGSALAQAFPSKPIRVVIPFVAGGSSDIVGHAIASRFQEILAACQTDLVGSQVDLSFQNLGAVNDAAVRTLRSPDIRERMNQIGFDVVASTPEEFGRFMQDEVERWTKVVERGGIKPE
jgi:tripartite-type tricarboxylate transporter receptor subunit TctC